MGSEKKEDAMGKKTEQQAPATLPEELAKEIEAVRQAALAEFAAASEKALEAARIAHLGMKGSAARLFERIPKIAPELRRAFGAQANALKAELERALAERSRALEEKALAKELSGEKLDVTLPGGARTWDGATR